MDKGRNKRIAVFMGLLALLLFGIIYTAFQWINTVHMENDMLLGRLILAKPETKGEYVSAVEGRSEFDISEALAAGRAVKVEYGYSGRYAAASPSIASFLPVLLLSALFFALLLSFLILYQKKLQSQAEFRIFRLEDRAAQLTQENRLLQSRIERETAETKNTGHRYFPPVKDPPCLPQNVL